MVVRRMFLLLLTLAATALAAQPAPEPRTGDTTGWHVVRSGETLQGITARYLGSAGDWRENWKLNPALKDPNRLKPGDRIRVILARHVPARSADVRSVSRIVERQPTPEPWRRAATGDHLQPKHGLRTREKSSAELGFADGATLTLTENSMVFLRDAPTVRTTVARDSIEIVDGQVDVERRRTRKTANDIEILVAGATVAPKPATTAKPSQTRARAASKSAQFMVYGGDAVVEAAGAKVTVPTGMGTRVPEGSKPGALEKLLPAPAAIEPAADSSRSGATAFRWKPVSGAAKYVVEVCADPACASLVDRATTHETAWRPGDLPVQKLFWRVTAVAPSQLDGFPSAPVPFTNSNAIAGAVAEESTGSRIAGARLVLYRDGGDGMPTGDDDTLAAETTTDSMGTYSLPVAGTGTYWVAVDSRSLAQGAWAEQSAAPTGGLCEDGSGRTIELAAAGPCPGGRRGDVSDDARRLATSEHVARIETGGSKAGVGGVDFRFRFDIVTTARDDDDDPASEVRSVQGSLRQFIANANAIPGPNAMRFVPARPANSGEWWSIALDSPLPALTDAGTTLDGRAGSLTRDPKDRAVRYVNESVPVGTGETMLERVPRPDLEIRANGLGEAVVIRAPATLHHLAVSGAARNVEIAADTTVEDVVIGARPDGSRTSAPGTLGIAVRGNALVSLSRVYIAGQGGHGLLVASPNGGARVLARHLDIRNCGGGTKNGDAIALHSDRSVIMYSLVTGTTSSNPASTDGGAAMEIWADGSDEGKQAAGNVVEQCTFDHNHAGVVISTRASGNRVVGNVIRDTPGEPVVVRSDIPGVQPAGNDIRGNGR